MASRKRLLIFVASAISLSEMPRISRSRRSSSPNDANSECGAACGWPSWSGMSWRILRREEALDAAPQIRRRGRVAVDGAQVVAAEMAELRRGRGARRERVQHQRLADAVAARPLPIAGQHAQLLRRRPRRAGQVDEVLFAQPRVRQQRLED